MDRKEEMRLAKCEAQKNMEKPVVQLVKRPNGSLLILGCTEAAKFCGVSQQAFGRVVRAHAVPKVKLRTIYTIERKVREKYPELFADVAAGGRAEDTSAS